MPAALIVAFVVSLGAHALALFGTELDLAPTPEPLPLAARLNTLPPPVGPAKVKKPAPKPAGATRALSPPVSSAVEARSEDLPVADLPATAESAAAEEAGSPGESGLPGAAEDATAGKADAGGEAVSPASPFSRLPERGLIRYQVERGDQGLVVGQSVHDWQIDPEGRYRLTAVTETTGLAALIKPLRIEHESLGRIDAEGLQPERFTIRRNGRETREIALFDREQGEVRIGSQAPQALLPGAQDLLSFHYQLGFMDRPGGSIPIATGKKFDTYRLDVVGDEVLDLPAGKVRTLHLRTRGEKVTELWLAYDYLMLPVKIRHSDPRGDSFVQIATELQLSKE